MLTEKIINRLPPGRHRDGKIPGLEIVVHASGVKSWAYRHRAAGRTRNLTLGRHPNVTPEAARKAAQIVAGAVACGRDPAAERKAARQDAVKQSAPVRDLIEPVLKRYLRHAKERTRASTFRETERVMAKEVLPHWRGRRLSEVTRQDVRTLIATIAKRAPIGANRLLASLKTFFAFAVEQDILTVSPAASVRPPAPEKARERCLDAGELSAVLAACAGLGEYGAGVRLLALTGQRRSEVFGADWSEFDLQSCNWRLPAARAKNGRSHSVPLSDQAIAILESLPRDSGSAVFDPVSFSRMKGELDKLLPANMPKWTIHDLRRTMASGCASLGVQPHDIESCLNHKSGQVRGVAAIYNRYQYEPEKKAALALWGAHVAALVAAPASDLAVAA